MGIGYGKTTFPRAATTTMYICSSFSVDFILGAEYILSSMISIGLDLGYRLANIPKMSTGSSGSGSGGNGGGGFYSTNIKKTTVTNASGGTINYDFSGLIANLGINFKL